MSLPHDGLKSCSVGLCASTAILILLTLVLQLLIAAPAAADASEGWLAYETGNYTLAMANLQPIAEQGDAMAQYFVGVMLKNGLGVTADPQAAIQWLLRSARQGLGDAQAVLGLMYMEGSGVARDYGEAFRWTQAAAEQGNGGAMTNLGIM